MHNEWQNDYRIYGCAIQLDIIDGQIWIQHNSTEIYIEACAPSSARADASRTAVEN